MNIIVNARHMEITPQMRDYALDKASKLPRYFDRIMSIEVILDQEGGAPTCEVIVDASRTARFIGTHRGEDVYGCVDNAIHKVEEQIRRHKDKVRDRKGPTHAEQAEQAEQSPTSTLEPPEQP